MEPQKNDKACDNVICRSGERKCSRFIWANSNSLKRLKNNLLAACSHSWTLVCLQDVGISFSSVFFLSFKWLLNECERFYPCNNLGFFWSIAGCGRTCIFHLCLSSREETILAWASKLRSDLAWTMRWEKSNKDINIPREWIHKTERSLKSEWERWIVKIQPIAKPGHPVVWASNSIRILLLF